MKKKVSASRLVTVVYVVLKILLALLFLFILLALFCSCVGISMDITIRADGSGTTALEYRVSRMAETLGRLDGNERWNTVPVGRADFERTMARLPGLRLSSFSSSDNGTDLVTRAEISYKNIDDLLAFLEPSQSGSRATFVRENGVNTLNLILSDAYRQLDADLLLLAADAFSGYTLNFSLSVPGFATLALTDAAGNKIDVPPGSIRIIPQGKKVSVTMEMAELFKFPNGLGLKFIW